MKREEIEKLAAEYVFPDGATFTRVLTEFAVRVHDAALEEAADKAFNRGEWQAIKRIRVLKIGVKPHE